MELTSTYSRRTELAWKIVDGNALVLDDCEARVYSFNQAGTMVWQLLDGKHSLEAIIKNIAESFAIDFNRGRNDVLHLIKDLYKRDMIIQHS